MSVSRFAVGLSLVFSYPLLFVGTRDGFLDLFKVPERKRTNSFLNQLSIGTLAIITLLALQVKDLTFVASMSGAVFGTALIFIYPTLMFREAVKAMGERATKGQILERKLCGLIAAVGIAVGGIGAKMAWNTLS